jgi:hypothetical protein
MNSNQSIVICSQVKNRFYQFKETFYENLNTINRYPNVTWTIVDIGSNDGIEEFFAQFLSSYNKNNMNYYRVIEDLPYSIPIAKNFSLRLSNGYFLFNLDIDNYLDDIIDIILSLDNTVGIRCNTIKQGVYGRIGCHSDRLKIIGGYDESFLPAGGHENDLIRRLYNIGYGLNHIECKKMPIQNSKEETVKNFIDNHLSWQEMNKINFYKTQNNSNNKIINPNNNFTKASFIHNFKNKIELLNSC